MSKKIRKQIEALDEQVPTPINDQVGELVPNGQMSTKDAIELIDRDQMPFDIDSLAQQLAQKDLQILRIQSNYQHM